MTDPEQTPANAVHRSPGARIDAVRMGGIRVQGSRADARIDGAH